MQLSFVTHHSPSILLTQTIPIKKANKFEDMEMTAGGSCSMWNFLEYIRKGVEFARVINKKSYIVQGSSFMAFAFSRGVTHFQGITLAMTLAFSRIFKTNLEDLMEYLQRHFLNNLVCFFLEQITDRQTELLFWVREYPGYCTSLEFFPKPLQNKCVTDYIHNTRLSPISQ